MKASRDRPGGSVPVTAGKGSGAGTLKAMHHAKVVPPHLLDQPSRLAPLADQGCNHVALRHQTGTRSLKKKGFLVALLVSRWGWLLHNAGPVGVRGWRRASRSAPVHSRNRRSMRDPVENLGGISSHPLPPFGDRRLSFSFGRSTFVSAFLALGTGVNLPVARIAIDPTSQFAGV